MRIDTPAILFDLKKNRIRIHQNTLKALNNPDYVLLLINPIERLVAVQASNGTDARAHRVSNKMFPNQCFEIYSASLLQQLRLCSQWDKRHNYRIEGNHVNRLNAVQFDIRNSQTLHELDQYKTKS